MQDIKENKKMKDETYEVERVSEILSKYLSGENLNTIYSVVEKSPVEIFAYK